MHKIVSTIIYKESQNGLITRTIFETPTGECYAVYTVIDSEGQVEYSKSDTDTDGEFIRTRAEAIQILNQLK